MRLALAPIDPTIGDLAANAALIARSTQRARDAGADLVVFPELALTGYPPRDLLLQGGFIGAVADAAKALGERHSAGLTLVFGCPLPVDPHDAGAIAAPARGGPYHPGRRRGLANALLAYRDGALLACYDKRLLPTYDVFDEDRYFIPGSRPVVIPVAGLNVGLTICEDLWRGEDAGFADRYAAAADPVAELVNPPDGSPGSQLIINPSASPFVLGKGRRHRDLLRGHAEKHNVFVAAVNQLGGNDELIFDGHAAVYAPGGRLIAAGRGFVDDLLFCDIDPAASASPTAAPAIPDPVLSAPDEDLLFRALSLGVRDYARKTGFKTALIGLSGGIDSAVTAVLAAAALGPANVTGVALPSRYSSPGSVTDAAELARRLGLPFQTIPISAPVSAFTDTLAASYTGPPRGVTEENLQSRVRGTILMALSNQSGALLLTTGNKSELAVGYCTLYGDMNGGLAVLADVSKTLVYRLARWVNSNPGSLGIESLSAPPIPEPSITKPPSAELRPGQTDQDTLPPYEVLDEIIGRSVEGRESAASIARAMAGRVEAATITSMLTLIDRSEFKRGQAAPGLKVTGVAFGTGRRMPIAQRWRPAP